jgi:serine/threonine-protein kinase
MRVSDPAQKLVLNGRYRLDHWLAAGGMAEVYAATDELLQRRVAVKLSLPTLARDPAAVERFQREARAVAALSHPNIATVFDFGCDQDRHFLVMELLEGKDLACVLREESALPFRRAAGIALQVAEALAHAHSRNIVHRDVKPANIMLDADDCAKVTDFGIARILGDAPLTRTGSVFGTPRYMSPEQASGSRQTARSDVYSLGVVLYEMLTGLMSFEATSPIAVALHHLETEIGPPSELNPEVPPALDRIVARATAKREGDRFDASEMAEALRQARPTRSPGETRVPTTARGALATSSPPALPLTEPWPGSRQPGRRMAAAAGVVATLVVAAALLGKPPGDKEQAVSSALNRVDERPIPLLKEHAEDKDRHEPARPGHAEDDRSGVSKDRDRGAGEEDED